MRNREIKLPLARTKDVVVQDLKTEVLVYDLKTNQAFCLNDTSAKVFNACDGLTTFDELKSRYKFSADLIHLALDELSRNNLIESDYESPLAGISRREAIRQVGLASLVSLPVISALIAPQASHAASPSAPGSRSLRQACNTSTECASGAPHCTNTPLNSGQRICCVGSVSYYDTGEVVNSCSGGSCSSANFACQANAGIFCCSGSATASCSGNSCACRCN